MITIKEIAKLADVSPSTVSIVLNNKAKERSISEATVAKVQAIAAKNGYRPNVQAVGLRVNSDDDHFRIIVFWTADYRAQMMLRFIHSLEQEILVRHYKLEVLLKPYNSGHLQEALTDELVRSCHGMIICNSSESDMEYLENNQFSRPIVIYNRYSYYYTTVTLDDKEIGTIPAEVFASHQRKHPALITYPVTFNGMNIRTNCFSARCQEAGMAAPYIYTTPATLDGGYEATLKAFSEHPEIDCIFYASDILAVGSLKYFNQNRIRVPQDIEFIAAGNYEDSWSSGVYPSISVVRLPIEEMAAQCLGALHSLMTYHELKSDSIECKVQYISRESAPEKRAD